MLYYKLLRYANPILRSVTAMTDKAVLICGLIISAAAAAGLAASLIVCRMKELKLNAIYDEEYGRQEQGKAG